MSPRLIYLLTYWPSMRFRGSDQDEHDGFNAWQRVDPHNHVYPRVFRRLNGYMPEYK